LAFQFISPEPILKRAWMRRGMLACALWPLAQVFHWLIAVRRVLYRSGVLKSARLPVPVVVVGNVFVGGTGKTPFVIWLVDELRRAGHTPGVVSRGYGATGEMARLVTPDSAPDVAGDEPLLIAQRVRCPVAVGRNRVDAARALLAAHPAVTVIISDDGLQHYALRRDIEIVLFDARGAGNGWLLPAGPLREPKSRRRDFTVVNAAHIPPDLPPAAVRMQLAGEMAERLADRSQRIPLRSLAGRAGGDQPPRIAAAAGIGNPARFFSMLRQADLVFDEMPLPDHYRFGNDFFSNVSADIILITEKDAVKCSRIDTLRNDPRIWIVPVTAHIDGALAEKIVEKLRGCSTA
jgi:tetraacyldisaccharide 4'-kinase